MCFTKTIDVCLSRLKHSATYVENYSIDESKSKGADAEKIKEDSNKIDPLEYFKQKELECEESELPRNPSSTDEISEEDDKPKLEINDGDYDFGSYY